MDANTQVVSYTGIKERATELLGNGISASLVAQTLGVSESYVSQLLANEEFLRGVVDRRYQNLAKHNARDSAYDELEDDLLKQLKETSMMLFEPMKIAKVLQTVNAAKRRGQSTPDSITQQNTIVNLTLPTVVIDRHAAVQATITKDVNNQVVTAGGQTLVTIQSNSLMDRLREKNDVEVSEITNAEPKQVRGGIVGTESTAGL